MKFIRNSQNLFILGLYLIVLVLLFALFVDSLGVKFLSFFVLPILFSAPLLIVVGRKKTFLYIFFAGIVLLFFIAILGVSLRNLKSLLPYPKIDELNTIGYEHYYNYPLNLDSIVLYLILVSPFLSVIVVWIFLRKNK